MIQKLSCLPAFIFCLLLTFHARGQGTPPPLEQGLVAWYKLDELTGTQAADATVFRSAAYLAGGGSWQPAGGHIGGALQLPPFASLRIPLTWQPTQFSVSWWVKANSRANWTQSVGASLNYGVGEWWNGFMFHTGADGRIYVGTQYPGWLSLPAETFQTGVWQHFVFTFDMGVGCLYKDGQLLLSQAGVPMPSMWRELAIGSTLTAQQSADGLYDDLRVYNRPLPANQVLDLFTGAEPCALLTLSASPNVSIPTGDAVVLRAYPSQAGAALQWSPATGLSTTTGAAVTAAPTATTTYTVTATTTGACPATTQATVRVTVTPPLVLSNPPVDGCAPTLLNTPPPARPNDAADAVNYVRTYTARAAFTNPADLRAAPVDEVQVKTEYLDGLGRPVQTVLRQESPERHDIVQPVAYDALGRQPRQYLPYAASATPDAVGYYPHALTEQYAFYRETPTGPGFASDHIARTGVPFSETVFEASPLNRVLEQAAPGEAWRLGAGHIVGQTQRPNTAADVIPRYTPGYDPTPIALTYEGAYPAGELWLTEGRDERDFRTQEFTDKQGQVVAKRVECPPPTQNTPGQATPTWLTTLYIYDDFNRLRTVVPPKAFVRLPAANWQVTATVENLLFRYRYDGRGRMVGKNVPGQAGETQLVYDQLDRPVMSQDPEQRRRREWSWTKYDALGRVVMTGLTIRNVSQTTAQTEANNWLTPGTAQYTAQNRMYEQRTASTTYSMRITTQQAYPPMSIRGFSAGPILTATYYDDYDYDQNGQPDVAFDAQYNAQFTSGQVPVADLRTVGLPTRTKTRVLSALATDPNLWLTVTTFYDEKARPVQVRSTNARGGEDVVTTQLDFTGKVVKSYATHTGPNLPTALTVAESFTYDHAGRLTEARQQLPGETQPVLIAEPRYNELGQLINKTLAPGTALQQRVDFAYNIRGWLTHVNDPALSDPTDLWGMQLSYDCGFQESQYTGNIAGQKWRSKSDGVERAYGYLYDGASRLLSGDFVARNAATQAWTAERQRYGLSGMRYDENGNILGLQRRGLLAQATRTAPAQFGATDELSYSYTGNRLTRVDDAVSTNALPRPAGYQGAPTSLAGDFQEEGVRQAGEYTYDNNGNLTKDANKRITAIAYNHLNLPRRIVFGTGADSIVFRYSAAGQKVMKRVYQTGKPLVQTDYLGTYQYEGDSLRFFPHAEGRVLRRVQRDAANQPVVSYRREYSLKDHLGNLRVAYKLGDTAHYEATMELAVAAREEAQFEYVAATRHATSVARAGQQVARLNAATGQPLGPLKLLPVQKGDTVTFTAPGLYQQPVRNTSFGFSLPGFVASLLLQPAPAPPIGPDGRPRPRALPFLGIGLGLVPALTPSGRVPKGYARLLVYNQDSVLVNSYTRQLSAAALNSYEELYLQVIAPSQGYVTAYVGNESDVDVFFDEVTLDYRPALLVQENQYDPWGLSLAGLDKMGGLPANQYQYNGKEIQTELGLDWQDYGWRNYDPQLGRWHVVDPLAEKREWLTPYNVVQNNPVNRFDPNGLTDFTMNKKTGEVREVTYDDKDKQKANIESKTDRIVKSNNEGVVKTKKNGDARTDLGNIEKGILKNGQNWKNDDQVIDVGGKSQASLDGVEDFVTRFSEYIGKEIAGAYLSQENKADAVISKVYIDEYNGNGPQQSSSSLTSLFTDASLKGFNTITDFHTHPSNLPRISRLDIERPSGTAGQGGDLGFRDKQKSYFYNFLILTRTGGYPSNVQKIPYTNWQR